MPISNPAIDIVEAIAYNPALQDSGDLEAGTTGITATSEPGSADYSATLGVSAPSDSRLSVKATCVQLLVTIDSYAGGGLILNYRIKKGGTSVGTGTLSTGGSTGAKQVAHDILTGTLTGNALYEVFLWVNGGTCTISVCRLKFGVGSSSATMVESLRLTYSGMVSVAYDAAATAGTATIRIFRNAESLFRMVWEETGAAIYGESASIIFLVSTDVRVDLYGSVATDLHYIVGIEFTCRRSV